MFLRKRRKVHDNCHGPLSPGRNDGSPPGPLKRLFVRQPLQPKAISQSHPNPLSATFFDAQEPPNPPKNEDGVHGLSSFLTHCQVVFGPGNTSCGDSSRDISADDDEYSEESLLSAWSVDEDQTRSDANCRGLARVRESLDRRTRLMTRLTARKSKTYKNIIVSRQLQVSNLTLELHSRRRNPDRRRGQDVPIVSRTSLVHQVTNHIFFEAHHSLEASWNLLWYSAGHLSVYMGLDASTKLIRVYVGVSEVAFHTLILVLAIVIMRLNGYVWQWLGHDGYRLVKFDLHNRRILGMWDASLMNFFRRDLKAVNGFISILAYYLVFISLTYFYNKIWAFYEFLMSSAYTSIEALWLTRLQTTELESYAACLEAACTGGDESLSFFGCARRTFESQAMNFFCLLLSDPDLSVLSIIFHSLFCFACWGALRVFQVGLFET